jgi:hypothetical protein
MLSSPPRLKLALIRNDAGLRRLDGSSFQIPGWGIFSSGILWRSAVVAKAPNDPMLLITLLAPGPFLCILNMCFSLIAGLLVQDWILIFFFSLLCGEIGDLLHRGYIGA